VSRTRGQRAASVRRLLAAAERVYEGRHALEESIAKSTGLSPEGVALGFDYLERSASDAELEALVEAVPEAAHVHVILSANVFVAPLRALALAMAAAPKVTVRPSAREPWLTRALVDELEAGTIEIVDERDVGAVDADSFHVYGRDSTIADVRARARPGSTVRGHGAGLGVAVVGCEADLAAAAARIALDVAAFDQRGCLSPRLAIVEGDSGRAARLAESLHRELSDLAGRVPRGRLDPEERADARRWTDTLSFAGRTWEGAEHGVGLSPEGAPLALPPQGRYMLVARAASLDHARALLVPLARFIVAAGTDDPTRARSVVPAHARISPLGFMQRPALDGPVDRRPP
jgi:hypothetical protein